MVPSIAALLLSVTPSLAGEPAIQDAPPADRVQAIRQLFLTNCASCHGAFGNGEGVTDLDRQARNFKDGGFSYGNTPDAIVRTTTTGIPGTPMPSFGDALTAEEIADLAHYVIELGPGLPPEPENTEMIVRDRALVVRGLLPPIVDGVPERPRGLLIGLPSGLGFEYRTDDVRLLGVRQGRFVDRRDWSGRGGSSLEPLGKVVALVEEGDPGPSFSCKLGDAGPTRWTALHADLRSTRSAGEEMVLSYMLQDGEGADLCHVQERCTAESSWLGSGYRRVWMLRSGGRALELAPRPWNLPGAHWVRMDGASGIQRRLLEDGAVEVSVWLLARDGKLGPVPPERSEEAARAGDPFALRLEARDSARLELVRIVLPPGSACPPGADEAARQLFEELTR